MTAFGLTLCSRASLKFHRCQRPFGNVLTNAPKQPLRRITWMGSRDPAASLGIGGLATWITAIVLLPRPPWSAIVLYAVEDPTAGVLAWLVLRDPVPTSPAAESSWP